MLEPLHFGAGRLEVLHAFAQVDEWPRCGDRGARGEGPPVRRRSQPGLACESGAQVLDLQHVLAGRPHLGAADPARCPPDEGEVVVDRRGLECEIGSEVVGARGGWKCTRGRGGIDGPDRGLEPSMQPRARGG